MSKTTAAERASRILSIVPWVAERDGPTLGEVCERFAISRADLLSDLEVVFLVGTPPYTPDTLIEVHFEDDRVWVHLGDYFRRPLRLNPAEALELLTKGRAWLQAAGRTDSDGSLARALDKLASSLGPAASDSVSVELDHVQEGVLDTVRRAIVERRQMEIDYYSYGKDERTTRTVDGWRVFVQEGSWYLLGWCHLAGGERMFRLDRIERATLLDETFEPPDRDQGEVAFEAGPDAPRVTLHLAPAASWVVDHFPQESTEYEKDGSIRTTLAVTALPWLARLLLRLGHDGEVVEVANASDEVASEIRHLRADAATRILDRYRSGGTEADR